MCCYLLLQVLDSIPLLLPSIEKHHLRCLTPAKYSLFASRGMTSDTLSAVDNYLPHLQQRQQLRSRAAKSAYVPPRLKLISLLLLFAAQE